MVKAQLKCIDCGRLIWVSKGQEPLCQNCKNRRSSKEPKSIKVLSSRIDLREEVRALHWAERHYPQIIEKLRNKNEPAKEEKA